MWRATQASVDQFNVSLPLAATGAFSDERCACALFQVAFLTYCESEDPSISQDAGINPNFCWSIQCKLPIAAHCDRRLEHHHRCSKVPFRNFQAATAVATSGFALMHYNEGCLCTTGKLLCMRGTPLRGLLLHALLLSVFAAGRVKVVSHDERSKSPGTLDTHRCSFTAGTGDCFGQRMRPACHAFQ